MPKIQRFTFAIMNIILVWKNKTNGQDTLVLPTQNIIASRTFCVKVERLNIPFTTGSLADVTETPFIFRRYSPGGLASVSLRGTAPTHTQLYWNGMVLHSPLLGQSDFNLFFDGGEILYGGASLEYGIGGFGGGVLWNDEMPTDKQYRISVSGGSFGSYATNNHFSIKHKKIGVKIDFNYRYADNDFSYINTSLFGRPKVSQRSAKAWFAGIKPVVFYRFHERHELCFGAWNQWAFRQIPPPQTVRFNEESQEDRSQRYLMRWNYKGKKTKVEAAAGYFNDYLYYENRLSKLFAPNISEVWQSTINVTYHLNTWKLKTGINAIHAEGKASVYENRRSQTRLGQHFSLSKSINRWNLNGLIRYDYQNQSMISYRLGGEKEINFKKIILHIYANAGKNFRPPTLNDLYWIPGGNPNLRAESGYFAETGTEITYKNLTFNLTGYLINIDNWIQWFPQTATIWSPQNLKTVSSYGTESTISHTRTFKEINLKYSMHIRWNRAVSRTSSFYGDMSVGKQMIYLPEFSGWSTLYIEGKYWSFGTELTGNSRRFVAADHSDYLPAYALLNAIFGVKYRSLNTKIRCQNITNVGYFSMPNRPMPGFHLFFELVYEINR